MTDLLIGISGLRVAQQAIEVISNNIANASTEGYHRQEVRITPEISAGPGQTTIGNGASVTEIRRNIDSLLEREITRQQPQLGQINQELLTLETIEATLGEISGEGLSSVIGRFFNSFRELAANPDSLAMREQVAWAGDELANQFRNLGNFLADLTKNIEFEAATVASQVNDLTWEIAELNNDILAAGSGSGAANMLCDRRDQAVNELAELVNIQVNYQGNSSGMVDVAAWGHSLVLGRTYTEIETGSASNGMMGLSIKDADYYRTDISGGKLGALLNLSNNIIGDLKQSLDTLADEIVTQTNKLHVQGVGTDGAFGELTGWAVGDEAFATWTGQVSAGDFNITVTDTSGVATRRAVSVNPSTDTIADIAARLNAIDNISASVANSALHVQADPGCTFDFLPALTDQPYSSTLSGTASPVISGLYGGDSNQVYTCTVVGTGQVGLTAGLAIEVRNGAGELATTLNVGAGYAPGDKLELDNGIAIELNAGTLNDAEIFTVQALTDSDPTGLLAAVGLNTFFSGNSAATIGVEAEILADPRRIASSLSVDTSGNTNAERLANLGEQSMSNLGGSSPVDHYRSLVVEVGQKILLRQNRRDGLEYVRTQLANQRESVSGVDVNEEAANLVIFERLFQLASKVISVQDETLDQLMEII